MSEPLSPMMRQYFEIKDKHKEHILFYRLGDFYEMFFDDALTASKELELTLTSRDCGREERAPMCGVPHHSSESYIARLIKKGYKVAICEQVENPSEAKGVVKREVVRVITPGTLIEDNLLDESANNYIASIFYENGAFGFSAADISTGSVHITEIVGEEALKEELTRFLPSEVVFNYSFFDLVSMGTFIKQKLVCSADALDDVDYESAESRIAEHFGSQNTESLSNSKPLAIKSLAGLLSYISKTQMSGLGRLIDIDIYSCDRYMNLDLTARRNLELVATMRTGQKRGSLLWVLDRTSTAMGRRLLRSYVEQPLVNIAALNKRLDAVAELFDKTALRDNVEKSISGIYDIERLITRIVYGSASPREVECFANTIARLPGIKASLKDAKSAYLNAIYSGIDTMDELRELLLSAIAENPPAQIKDGGVIRSGYNEALDKYRSLLSDTKGILAAIENRERDSSGIKNLKIGYNRVFGYYLEVTKSNLDMVPNTYIRKQTLANCERYITEELKNLENEILSASERIAAIELTLFEELRSRIIDKLSLVQAAAQAIARLDVYHCFAKTAVESNFCRPELNIKGDIEIIEGRHPVVEAILGGEPFVPNDVSLSANGKRVAIITGPNMAGKSTYIRQTALIVLMAQIGSFVPAKSAKIGIVDGIYTRVGASDDLATGQSTFMVEMSEVSAILKSATKNSLLILDEVGRGTSTFDGMSIARAMVEYIASPKKLGAKTLFATHYHELTELENELDCVKNYSTAVKKRGDDITFLRRIIVGGADDSYGIEVSKLAGIPEWIITRAKDILSDLEKGLPVASAKKQAAVPTKQQDLMQMSLMPDIRDEIKELLDSVDPNTLTPIEALNLVYKLKKAYA